MVLPALTYATNFAGAVLFYWWLCNTALDVDPLFLVMAGVYCAVLGPLPAVLLMVLGKIGDNPRRRFVMLFCLAVYAALGVLLIAHLLGYGFSIGIIALFDGVDDWPRYVWIPAGFALVAFVDCSTRFFTFLWAVASCSSRR
jgi:hypothetical protein